jgi:hypothetical protein
LLRVLDFYRRFQARKQFHDLAAGLVQLLVGQKPEVFVEELVAGQVV